MDGRESESNQSTHAMKMQNNLGVATKVIPYSKVQPLIGPAVEAVKDTGKFLENVTAECGEMGSYRFMRSRNIITSQPGLVSHVLESKNYRKVDNNSRFARAIGNGLLTSDGKKWAESRRVVQPLFSASYLEDVFIRNSIEIVESFKQRWREMTKGGPANIDLRDEMNEISFRIGLRIVFGSQAIDLKTIRELNHHLIAMKKYIVRIPPRQWLELRRIFLTPSYLRFTRSRAKYNRLIRELISKHARSSSIDGGEVYLIDYLLNAMHNNPKFAPDTFETELTTLAFASSISTGIALQWMWVLLDQNNNAAELVRKVFSEEVNNTKLATEEDKVAAYANLCRNEVLQACVKEVLRLRPPFWFQARKAMEDDVYEGIEIRKGTCVLINVVMLHRSTIYWKNPNSFDHSRFLEPQVRSITEGSYIPFGAGGHKCPASRMASMEMAIVAAMLLDEFDIVIQNPCSLRTTKQPDLLMESEFPIKAQISRRVAR